MKKSELRQLIREEVAKLITEAAPKVVTREYQISHGKEPTGTGNWAFRLEQSSDRGQDGDMYWPSQGGKGPLPFKKALQLAQKEAKDIGANYVIVMP